MSNLSLEFVSDDSKTGFRLNRLEIFNWGTFHHRIWDIHPDGGNSLLTGDIGSGKSTLIDAITTLLVPHHKIVYNKAAGAEGRERNLKSYIRGEYKNIKSDLDNSSKPVYLRDDRNYTVLLGRFDNQGFDQRITLAQLFWNKSESIDKFFVISDQALSIKEHFKVESDVLSLKKRLRRLPRTELFDSFSDYSSNFRSRFGIKSEKALDLFNQTVSMKSIGNLNDFVRHHMLEKPDVKEKIDGLKRNYENLTKAHDAVQKATRQLEQLRPLAAEADRLEEISRQIKELNGCLDAHPAFFASQKIILYEEEIARAGRDLKQIVNRLNEVKGDLETLRINESEIEQAIANDREGQRISQIEKEIERVEGVKTEKLKRADEYQSLAALLDLPSASGEEIFYQSLEKADVFKEEIPKNILRLTEERDDLTIQRNEVEKSLGKEKNELESLRMRKNQIPEENLKLRGSILRDLEMNESELPFSGELLKVKDQENVWEGAVERLLHNFGLSLLVREADYKRISHYVNQTALKGRLVYYKVSSGLSYESKTNVQKNGLFTKVEVKSDSPFYDWLEKELIERFNYVCCETVEEFQRETNAITKEGQIKSGKIRHEKDDRRNLHDKRFYILGWSNAGKIKAIEGEIARLQKLLSGMNGSIRRIENSQKMLQEKKNSLWAFARFKDFSEINWQKEAFLIEELKAEMLELEKSSDRLKTLKARLNRAKKEILAKEKEREEISKKQGRVEQEINQVHAQLAESRQNAGMVTQEEKESFFPKIGEFLYNPAFTLETVNKNETETRKKIEKEVRNKGEVEKQLRDKIISKMNHYKNDYPAETIEADASIGSLPEFRAFLKKIEEEDLPRHAERFKELLNEGAINDIAIFKNQLEGLAKDITDKIKQINKSLRDIEYNSGTYIELSAGKSPDLETREFHLQLRNCLENSFGENDLYNEEKFNRVKLILDRFNSGNPADMAWTHKVIDVRNWFTFSAIERWQEDNAEKEYYSDTSGKSGGQKEKLAYTILASALAYQFGLEWSQTRSRSFRFVVIDEAFGRGSDESTRYGLELFKKLNLQLLIVTPLQKINIIENYIQSVHFVLNNERGDDSAIKNLSIQEYRDQKEKYLNMNRTGIEESA